MAKPGAKKGPPGGAGPNDPIVKGLQDLFRQTEQEELPDRFKELLAKLAQEDGK
jgi:hypothetical protein